MAPFGIEVALPAYLGVGADTFVVAAADRTVVEADRTAFAVGEPVEAFVEPDIVEAHTGMKNHLGKVGNS